MPGSLKNVSAATGIGKPEMSRKPLLVEPDESARWLVSYADFMTLLLAFFVVMYAVSSIEEKKLKQVSNSINSALSHPISKKKESMNLPTISQELLMFQSKERYRKLALQLETNQMTVIADALSEKLAPLMRQGEVRVSQTARGISIEINSSILFAPAEAGLNNQSVMAIQSIAEVLQQYSNPIEVGGYTDNQPISSTEFPSNWELSAARASRVVRRLADFGINESRMHAIGYAANHPVISNITVQGRLRNRRVEIQILSK